MDVVETRSLSLEHSCYGLNNMYNVAFLLQWMRRSLETIDIIMFRLTSAGHFPRKKHGLKIVCDSKVKLPISLNECICKHICSVAKLYIHVRLITNVAG